jgi:3-hydroxymyristoyl/3-hydroxydecanoyl-(acyl carrier protein) dehydratase
MRFRMVDRIGSYEPHRSICGAKAVSFEEYSLRTALGCEPSLPESLLLESLFQLGNWLIVLSSDFTQMGLVIRTGRVEFLEPVGPGQRIDSTIIVKHYREDGICFDGEAKVGDKVVARGASCLAIPAPLRDYCDPDDLRVLFSEIHRPEED